MHPVLLDLGTVSIGGAEVPIRIGSYGVLFALAVAVGWGFLVTLGRQISREVPWTDVFLVTVVSGFVGAKLTKILIVFPDLVAGRRALVATLLGGGVWLGGVAVGFVACWLMMRGRGVGYGLVANAFFVAVPLSHAIGRVGCVLGGCCWGTRCDLPWAITYGDPIARRLNGTPLGVPLHPTALYESALEVGNFLVCIFLWRRKAPGWSILAAWMALYGTERFLLEFLRGDPRGSLGPLSPTQWIALGMALTAFGWLARIFRSGSGRAVRS